MIWRFRIPISSAISTTTSPLVPWLLVSKHLWLFLSIVSSKSSLIWSQGTAKKTESQYQPSSRMGSWIDVAVTDSTKLSAESFEWKFFRFSVLILFQSPFYHLAFFFGLIETDVQKLKAYPLHSGEHAHRCNPFGATKQYEATANLSDVRTVVNTNQSFKNVFHMW